MTYELTPIKGVGFSIEFTVLSNGQKWKVFAPGNKVEDILRSSIECYNFYCFRASNHFKKSGAFKTSQLDSAKLITGLFRVVISQSTIKMQIVINQQ